MGWNITRSFYINLLKRATKIGSIVFVFNSILKEKVGNNLVKMQLSKNWCKLDRLIVFRTEGVSYYTIKDDAE